jgi:hypothetical protein
MPWPSAVLGAARASAAADTQYSAVLGTLIMEILLFAAREAGSVIAGINNVG